MKRNELVSSNSGTESLNVISFKEVDSEIQSCTRESPIVNYSSSEEEECQEGYKGFQILNFLMQNEEIVETKKIKISTKLIFRTLNRLTKDSVIVYGKPGTGVTTLIKLVTKQIDTKRCPSQFYDTIVVQFDYGFFSELEDMDNILEAFLRKLFPLKEAGVKKIIVVMDDFDNFPGIFFINFSIIVSNLKYNLKMESLKFILGMKNTIIDNLEDNHLDVIYNSSLLEVLMENKLENMLEVMNPRIKELMECYDVSMSKRCMNRFLFFLFSENTDNLNYKLIYWSFDALFSSCELNGKKRVDEDEIRDFFSFRFMAYDKVPDFEKRRIAMHEAGHAVIALHFQEYFELLGIKIIQGYETLGSNSVFLKVWDPANAVIVDEKYTISILAFYLAGRNGENNLSLSARLDIETANSIAEDFVMHSGIYKEIGINRYYDSDKQITQTVLNSIENIVRKLLLEANEMSKSILSMEEASFNDIVEALIKKAYLTKNEVLTIWKRNH